MCMQYAYACTAAYTCERVVRPVQLSGVGQTLVLASGFHLRVTCSPPKRAARQSWPLCVCARAATLSSSTCATSVHVTTLRRHAARAERDEGATRRRGESPNQTLLSVRPPPYRRSWASLQSELLPLGTGAHSQVTDARSRTYLSYVFNKLDAESELLRCAHLMSSPDTQQMTRHSSGQREGFSLEVTECITCPTL